MFKITKLEAWGERIPTLSELEVYKSEFDSYMEAYNYLHEIATDYPDEEIERLGNNMLEIRFKLTEEQAYREFNARHIYVKVVYFITEE